MMAINGCPECLKKQRLIDELTEELEHLRGKLKYQRRKQKEGLFGSSTPSSKVPVKSNTPEEKEKKKKGAKPGHKGSGRTVFDESGADRLEDVLPEVGQLCPECGGPLEDKGNDERPVLESPPLKAEKLLYRLPKKHCPRCHKTFQPRPPGVLPRSLFGNQLISTLTVMHYLHGIPMGRICEQIGVGAGSVVEIFHRLARLFAHIPQTLIEQYRQAWVKHADETGWRTNGKNGYAWLFATKDISLFQFKKTRAASVPLAVLGTQKLPGILIVDRYAGYNKVPCDIQYCYSHLLRDVQDLQKEFPDEVEVHAFVGTVAPLLCLAMGLRAQPLSNTQFHRKAARVKNQIQKAMDKPAQHLGIRHIQDIFRENKKRLYHWAKDREIPAENNLAERDLRPTVIARKVSFGSQSDAGAHTRSIMMTVVHTLKKRVHDVSAHLKYVLDELSKNLNQDPLPFLFSNAPPPEGKNPE